MTTKRKRALLAVGALSLAAMGVGILLAYFAGTDDQPNLVGIGEDKIVVTEAFTQPKQMLEPFIYRKLVKIQNTGSVPCYIRVRLDFSNSTVQNAASFSYANADSNTPPAESTFQSAVIAEGSNYYIHPDHLPEDWVYVWEKSPTDPAVTYGYYYYTKPVDPEKSTSALLSWVRMAYEDNADIQAHDLYVYAESVQTVDVGTSTEYADWKDAWHKFAG